MDLEATFELVQLICDIEHQKRPGTEFFLIYRKDCPLWVAREFMKLASRHFERSAARMARNHDVGWPGGPNMLAASAFIELSILRREALCKNSGFLLFEPDCVPLSRDWLDRLSDEWDRLSPTKEAFGHWHDLGHPGPDTGLHMNGNAVFRTSFFDDHPTWIVGPGTLGWDYWFREKLLSISADSNLIFQNWNRHGMPQEELAALTKNGQRPVFFHGIKTPDGRQHARSLIFAPAVA